jgi:hypothetical protein
MEHKARLQLGRGQVIVDFAEPSHTLESCCTHLGVEVVSGRRRHRSPLEAIFVVPGQSSGIGSPVGIRGRVDRVTVERVVVLSVVELLPDTPADLEAQVRRYRYVAGVEQAVNVPTQEKSVPCLCAPPSP